VSPISNCVRNVVFDPVTVDDVFVVDIVPVIEKLSLVPHSAMVFSFY
jgi:hypothetical protein